MRTLAQDEKTLKYQERMEWEKPYMEALIKALAPSGDVLEVGFSLWRAGETIQSFHPKSHTIIECEPKALERARSWLKDHPEVRLIEDLWERVLPSLGVYDAIFFNDHILEGEMEMAKFQQNGSQLLHRGEALIADLKKQFPEMTTLVYSDKDLEEFYQQVGKGNQEHLSRFFSELKNNKQISEKQYESSVKKYHLQKEASNGMHYDLRKRVDRTFLFLQECLVKHMRKGSRFSGFSLDPTSKYEDPQFFDHILTNPFIDYREEWIDVEVPCSCTYYSSDKALVMVIEKME